MMLNMVKSWWKDDRAVIAIEVGLLFPTMLTLLLGVMDIGNGVYISQKLIDADQMMADLLTRNPTVSKSSDLPNAIIAGQLTMSPFDTSPFGADIVGIEFINSSTNPVVEWRDTVNTSANQMVPADASGLGNTLEGVIVVTTVYTYTPFFTGGLTGSTYAMQETAFARGRNGLYIPEES
jgi:Flp pilus assembly protein TadG